MLKVKDNVELKELEKFGFVPIYESGIYPSKECDHIIYRPKNSLWVLSIDKITKIIYLTDNSNHDGLLKIYDLIQAGLVEKIGE